MSSGCAWLWNSTGLNNLSIIIQLQHFSLLKTYMVFVIWLNWNKFKIHHLYYQIPTILRITFEKNCSFTVRWTHNCETRTFPYFRPTMREVLGTPRRDHDAQRYSTTNYRGRRCRHAPAPTTASDLGSSSPNCCPRRNHRCVSSAINNAPICTTTLIREDANYPRLRTRYAS